MRFKKALIVIFLALSISQSYSQQSNWMSFYCGKVIESIVTKGKDLWVSSSVGFAKINLETDAIQLFDKTNSRVNFDISKNLYIKNDGTLFYTKWFSSGIGYFVNNNFVDVKNIGDFRSNIIFFDKNDYLWLGTRDGIASYSFTSNYYFQQILSFTTSNSSLPSSSVVAAQFDSKGNLWIACTGYDQGGSTLSYKGGIAKYDGLTWTIYTKANSPLTTNQINCLTIDKNDNVWIGTYNGYLHKISNNVWSTYSIPQKTAGDATSFTINTLASDSSGNIWVGTLFRGLYKFDGSNWKAFKAMGTKLSSDFIKALAVDYKNRLWVGTQLGLFRLEGDDFIEYSTSNSKIPSTQLNNLIKDSRNNLWFICDDYGSYNSGKTTGGVVKYDGKDFTFFDANQLTNLNDYYRLITEDCNSNIWVTSGSGLLKYDGFEWKLFKYPAQFNNDITGLTSDLMGNIWMGSNLGDLIKFDGLNYSVYPAAQYSLPKERISSMTSYGNNVLITYSKNQSVIISINSKLSKKNLLYERLESPFNDIYCIRKNNNGNLWIGSVSNGLARFDGEKWKIFNSENSELPSNSITSISFDNNGKVIIVCNEMSNPTHKDGGLAVYDGVNFEVFKFYNSPLPLRYLRSAVTDNNNNIWLLGYTGLSVFNKTEVKLDLSNSIQNKLSQNFPNPFNSTTIIKYTLANQGNVRLKIIDILGKEVRTLINMNVSSGDHLIEWDGKNDYGVNVASGIYLFQLFSENFIEVKKMILTK